MTSIRKKKKNNAKREEKWKKQRMERGYSDCDVWDMYTWFIGTIKPMLEQLSKNHMGFPASIGKNWFDKHESELGMSYEQWISWPSEESDPVGYKRRVDANNECDEEWKGILNRMVFLLGEMGEDTCTKKNPYEDAMAKAYEEFHEKYGSFGDGLKTEEEKEEENRIGLYRMYHPTDEPGRDDVKELFKKYMEEDHNIAKYRDDCKNEFFELFSKHFWNLWD